MKIKLIEEELPKKTAIVFPCILKSAESQLVVFFWENQKGIVLSNNHHSYKAGHISLGWNSVHSTESHWQYYQGEIILSNDQT